jgi:hypothetical protein
MIHPADQPSISVRDWHRTPLLRLVCGKPRTLTRPRETLHATTFRAPHGTNVVNPRFGIAASSHETPGMGASRSHSPSDSDSSFPIRVCSASLPAQRAGARLL